MLAALRRLADSAQPASAAAGAEEMDDDWLASFRREAVQRSRVDVQEAFARILAGEIRRPGTFSIRTFRTVSALSQQTAALFQRATSLRVGLELMATVDGGGQQRVILDARVPALDDHHGTSALQKECLSYGALTELIENGLLQPDYGSWYDYKLSVAEEPADRTPLVPFVHQNRRWVLLRVPDTQSTRDVKLSGVGFTAVGKELLRIVDIEEDAAFLQRVHAYFRSRSFNMVPAPDPKT